MTHDFDKNYWEQHWEQTHHPATNTGAVRAPNPYVTRETADLQPGSALDAGCGSGAEAIWLATNGWQVTAADISATALAGAADQAARAAVSDRVTCVEADLTTWQPAMRFDLVATNYAHPAMPQLAFYDRLRDWVAPGGTLLIVGHLHDAAHPGHDHHQSDGAHDHDPPAKASVTLGDVTAGFSDTAWTIVTAEENTRTVPGRELPLRDVVVRAARRR